MRWMDMSTSSLKRAYIKQLRYVWKNDASYSWKYAPTSKKLALDTLSTIKQVLDRREIQT